MQFSLDDIRAAAEKKYGDLTIPGVEGGDVRLVNVLRLPKEKRNALKALQSKADEKPEEGAESPDEGEVLHESIRIVAASESEAERLLSVVGDDLTMLAVIFEAYTEGTELGEASASQN